MKRTFTFLCLFVSAISYAQVDLNLGLRAYYPFTGNANDVSGNNNNPVFNNATLISDQFGNANSAYHFNGIDNYMLIPNSSSLNMGSTISICAKVKATGFYLGPCENNMLVAKADDDFIQGTYSLRFADPVLGCTSNPPTTNEVFYGGRFGGGAIATTPSVNLNQWYSVVMTDDGTVSKIYVDCILRGTMPSIPSSATSLFNLYFGHLNNPQFPYWLNGDLDEVRIYDRAINEDEINLYGNCSIAPVTLTLFTTSIINNKAVRLLWKTEAESNIQHYTVKRSTTGYEPDFISLGTVVSKNNSHSNEYSFIDNTVKPHTLYYYKLVINDLDGSKKDGPIRTARITNNNFYTLVYPNPTDGMIKVIINNAVSDVNVKVMNNLGQLITEKKSVFTNTNPVLLDISHAAKGMYWVIIESENNKLIEKIIKQ